MPKSKETAPEEEVAVDEVEETAPVEDVAVVPEPVEGANLDEFERLKALNQVDTPRFRELKQLLKGG